MGSIVSLENANSFLKDHKKEYIFYAPKLFPGTGMYTDTDIVRYGEIDCFEEIVWDQKSDYSFKEILLPISQTLFYFTEDKVMMPNVSAKKPVIFMRSCDIHALKRLDQIYLDNSFEDPFYKALREKLIVVLMGCSKSFDTCFCVSMNTNTTEDYDVYVKVEDGQVIFDEKKEETPEFVSENAYKVNVPENIPASIKQSKMWEEYNSRCISCGRCNFACPTCTCFTMQDIYYADNVNVGERRRVWASCEVDDFDTIAGGIKFRKTKGDRMRYRVMHKVSDHKKRFGVHMCVGCGRCDSICPEYISFSNCINKLEEAIKEVENHE